MVRLMRGSAIRERPPTLLSHWHERSVLQVVLSTLRSVAVNSMCPGHVGPRLAPLRTRALGPPSSNEGV